MKTFFVPLTVAFAALSAAASMALAAPGWGDNFEQAVKQAKAEKKFVLIDFTGSDWCPPCIMLNKEVFSQKAFKNYARDKFVLVEADFPMGKKQPAKLVEQNEKLRSKFGVEGYPTIVVLNLEGKKVGELRYEEGGPAPFIAKLEALRTK